MTEQERARLVIENLGARIGQLMTENVDLLTRIYDLEQQLAAALAPAEQEEAAA